jgi:dephospho-CoA kinase
MTTYVVAIRREARSEATTAEEWVRQVPGVHVKGAGNPSRVVVEASPEAVSEIERRFGDKVLVEAEIRHERQDVSARKPQKVIG